MLHAKFTSIDLHNNSRISFFPEYNTILLKSRKVFYKSMLIQEWVAGGLQFHTEYTYAMFMGRCTFIWGGFKSKNVQLSNTAIWAVLFEKEPEHHPWENEDNHYYLKYNYLMGLGCYSPHPALYFIEVRGGENSVANSWNGYMMCWTVQSALVLINPKHFRFCIDTSQKIPIQQCLSGYFSEYKKPSNPPQIHPCVWKVLTCMYVAETLLAMSNF